MREAVRNPPPSSRVLVVYGNPPKMDIFAPDGRKLQSFELTRRNQASFEMALRKALGAFLGAHVNIAMAQFVFIRNADELRRAVQSANPSHLIYYGHALDGSNTLLPALGNAINAWQLTNALDGTGVKDFDILGCSSSSIAAELSVSNPRLRVGYLRTARKDNIEFDRETMRPIRMTLDKQPLLHFGR